jgi:ABC-type transporter Mla subunit MlaD
MEWSTILLAVLLAAAVWAVVEIALTIRRTRATISHLDTSLDASLTQVNSVLGKVDTTVEALNKTIEAANPAVEELKPLMGKVETTVDALSVDLMQVDTILSDVSRVTGSAANATAAVGGAVDSAAAAVTGMVDKVSSKFTAEKGRAREALEAAVAAPATLEGEVAVEAVTSDDGYFTYPGAAPESSPEAAATAAAPEGSSTPQHFSAEAVNSEAATENANTKE